MSGSFKTSSDALMRGVLLQNRHTLSGVQPTSLPQKQEAAGVSIALLFLYMCLGISVVSPFPRV